MRVSAQYAKEHFDEFLPSNDGDEVEIVREGERSVRLTLVPKMQATKEPLWGIGSGQLSAADDWDSLETNQAVADMFYESEIFPKA